MRIAFCNGIANDLDNRDHQDQNHHGNVDDVHPVPLLPVNIGVVAQASGTDCTGHGRQPDQADQRDRCAAGDSGNTFPPVDMEDDLKIAVAHGLCSFDQAGVHLP